MRYAVRSAQNVSRMCFVCGTENPQSLEAAFYELEGDSLMVVFEPGQEHQGYPGRLHGGIATTLLDEAIGRAINVTDPDAWGVTVELNVRFRRPVPLDTPVRAVCRITSDSGRLFEGSGEIILEDGTVAVEATGRYLRMSMDRIAKGDFEQNDWRVDERPVPEIVDI